jgi:hypothetical protein
MLDSGFMPPNAKQASTMEELLVKELVNVRS